VFCTYQLTFAIITPALICGSFADRMKYWPMLVFMAVWHLLVYCPIAHAVWHPDGELGWKSTWHIQPMHSRSSLYRVFV